MKKVFLYAGQGSQRAGMGLDFYQECPEYRACIDELDPDPRLLDLMHHGPEEELARTENTQICMGIFAAGVTEALRQAGIKPAASCGLSLGEYGALYAAGVFSAREYLRILSFRGKVMQTAAEGVKAAMSAVIGADDELILKVCQETKSGYVTAANFNCPGQTVIGGEEAAVAEAEERLKEAGVKRCIRLKVGGPFHTAFMEPAGQALADYFRAFDFKKPEIPVAMNVTGRLLMDDESQRMEAKNGTEKQLMDGEVQGPEGESGEELDQNYLKDLLVRQVQSSVRLKQDLAALLDAGFTDFLEIGPGNSMAGFLKKAAREKEIAVTVQSINSLEDYRKVISEAAEDLR